MTIEQEEFDLQQAKEELNNIDYMFPYADPEYKEMARKAAQRRVDVLQLRVNRKKNIALNTAFQNEAMYEEDKARKMEDFANMSPLEKAGRATASTILKIGAGAAKLPGYGMQLGGFLERWRTDDKSGNDLQTAGEDWNQGVDDFIAEGTGFDSRTLGSGNASLLKPSSWNAQDVGASAIRTIEGLQELKGGLTALGELGNAVGAGKYLSQAPAAVKTIGEGALFGLQNIPEHSRYYEQTRGEFSPVRSVTTGLVSGQAMAWAFALGRGGLGMTESQAMNFARESVRKGTLDLTKDAFKQAARTALWNGSLNGVGASGLKEILASPENSTWEQKYEAFKRVIESAAHETMMGGIFGLQEGFNKNLSNRQTYRGMMERGKVLLGEKPAETRTLRETLKQAVKGDFKGVKETFSKIWSPEINDKAFDTGVNEYFFGKEGAKLRGNPEEAEKLFAGPKQNIDTFVEKVRENLPQDSVSLKDPSAVEAAMNAYKASLYLERNKAVIERYAKEKNIDPEFLKKAYDRELVGVDNNGAVVFMAKRITEIADELELDRIRIEKANKVVESKDSTFKEKQEAAQQAEEARIKQQEDLRRAEMPYTRAEVIEAVRDMVNRGYGNNPELLNKATERLADFLSKYNSQEPIGVDDAIRLLNEVESELNKLNPDVKFDNYNSDIENIINPKLIGSDVIYGRDERNIPTSVIPTDYAEPRQIGYDGIIYGNDERNMPTSALSNNTQPQSVLPSPQETPLLEYNPTGRRQMPISEGSNQPINNMDVGSKVNHESPSSFGVVNDVPRSVNMLEKPNKSNMSEKPTGSADNIKPSTIRGKKLESPSVSMGKSQKSEDLSINGVAVKKGELKDRDMPMAVSQPSSEPMAVKKESTEKSSVAQKTPAENKNIEAKYAKFVNLVNEFKKNKNEELSKQEIIKLAKEAGLTKAEFIDLVNKSKEIQNNKPYAESMEDWENWKPSENVRQFVLNYGNTKEKPTDSKKPTTKKSSKLSKEAQKQYDFVKDLNPWEFEESDEGEINLKTIDDFKKTLEKENLPKAEKDKILAEVNDLRERTEKRVNKLKADEAELAKKIEESKSKPGTTEEQWNDIKSKILKSVFSDSEEASVDEIRNRWKKLGRTDEEIDVAFEIAENAGINMMSETDKLDETILRYKKAKKSGNQKAVDKYVKKIQKELDSVDKIYREDLKSATLADEINDAVSKDLASDNIKENENLNNLRQNLIYEYMKADVESVEKESATNIPKQQKVIEAPTTKKSSAVENIVRGKKTKMTTKANGGMKVDGEFAVVDVNKLKTATDIGKTQNRNRKTVASQAQVNSIANNPNPEYLIVDNPDSANGAMVVLSDGTVLSGNGRTLGLSEAYKYGNADKYKAYLKEHAPEFGIDPREIDKIENPVLVRIVDSKNGFDVKRFVKESNESRQLGRNAAETARTDAENIKGILREFNNIDDIASPSNKEFIQKFFEKTVGDTERANYLAEDGSLTQDGQRRIENALIASLYGDNPRLIEKLANTTNTGIKNVAKALIATAKDGAKLKGEVDKGMYFDVDLNKEISDAALTYADTVAEMHRQGVNGSPINFYLANMKDRLTPEGKLVFGMLSELNNKPKQVREFLQIINDVIRGHGDPQQGDLFAGKNPKPNKLQIIKEALQAFDSRYGTDFSKQDLSKWNKSERTLFDIGNEVREDGTPASVKKFVPDYKSKKKSSWTKEDWENYDNDQIKIAYDILGEENTDTTPIEKTNDIKLSKQQQNMYKSLKEFLPDIFEVYDREAESPAPVQALMNILRGGESLADIETAITRGDSREAIDIIKNIKQRVELTYSKDFSNRIAKNCDRLIKMIKNSNYRSNAIKPISLEELEAQPINRMPQEDVESWREGRELYVADKRETEPSKQSKREYADIARNVAELYREGKITKEQRKYFYDNLKPEYDFNLDVNLKKLEDYQKEIVSREREKLRSSEAFLVQSLNKGLISFNDFVERRRKLSIDYHDSLWKSGILTNGIRRQIVDPNRYKPQLSRTKNKATNPVTDKELNNFLRGQAKQISKETGLNFKVVDSVDELRKMFPNNDITDTVEGGIHKDTVYLVRGNIDRDRLPLVIAHEVAGHRGVESLFENKQQMDNFFNSLERAAVKDKFIRDAFAEVDKLGYKENRSREAMAKIVEKVRNESGTLKGTAKTFVNFITSRVRRLLRRMGFKNLQLNEAEVYDIAVQALRRTGLKNSNKFFGLDRFFAKDNSFLSATSTELDQKYPGWQNQTNDSGGHTTQIKATVNTYRKIGEWIKNNMKGAKILDASSGLGEGTEALKQMGLNIEDVEPYASNKRKNAPIYDSYDKIKGKYDAIISNAVLNVIPDNWRSELLHNMADKLNDGGKLFINVRDAKEVSGQKQKVELDSPSEILVTNGKGGYRAYQKGFTQPELESWVKKELGSGYKVEKANEKNSGMPSGSRAVVITKEGGNGDKRTNPRYEEITKQLNSSQLKNRMSNDSAKPLTPLKTLQGTPIKRYGNLVGKRVGGKDSAGGQIYIHKNYANEIIPDEILNKAKKILAEKNPDFKYNAIMWDRDKGTIRFDEAPNFDTAPEPIPGKILTINPSTGEIKEAYSDRIWHHKWLWVKDDYKGFDTKESWERSREWLNGLANLGLDKNHSDYSLSHNGIANGSASGYDAWNKQLKYYGLDHLIDDKNNTVPKADIQFSIGERKVKPAEDVAKKTKEDVYKDGYPYKRNFSKAVKPYLKKNLAEYEARQKGMFQNQKNSGYKMSAMEASYLTGFDVSHQQILDRFKRMNDSARLRNYVREYINANVTDGDKRAKMLDMLAKQKTNEGMYDVALKTHIEAERIIRNGQLNTLKQTLKDLKANKISREHSMLKLDALSNALTQEELDGLLDTNDFSTGAVRKMYSLLRTAKASLNTIRDKDNGDKLDVPVRIDELVAELDSKFNKSLIPEEGKEVPPSMKVSVEDLAKLNVVLSDIKEQSREAIKNLAQDSRNEVYNIQQQSLKEMDPIDEKIANSREDKRVGAFNTYVKPVTAVENLDLDNFSARMGDTMNKTVHKAILDGQKTVDHYLAKGYKEVDDIVSSFGKDKFDGEENLGKTFMSVDTTNKHKYGITKDEAMAIYALSTDRETRKLINAHDGLTLSLGDKKGSDTFILDKQKLKDIESRLTDKEKEAVARGKKLLAQTFLPALNDVYERLNGVPLRLIVDGTYFPRTYQQSSSEGSIKGVFDNLSQPYIVDSSTGGYASFLKSRGDNVNLRLRGFSKVIESYVNQASNYIGMAEPLKRLNRVLDNSMRKEITQRYGVEYVNRLDRAMKLISGMGGKTREDQQTMSRYLSNLAAAKLTPVSALKQFSSVPLASSVIPYEYLAKASIGGGLSKENIAEMMELDAMQLRYRDNGMGGIMPLNATTREAEHNLGTFKNTKWNKVVKWGLNLSLMADKRALGIIYKATKLMAEAKGKGSDKAWIENKFMEAVRRTQNTTDLASAPGWQELARNSSAWAFINMYLNQTQKIPNEFLRLKRFMNQAEKKHGKDSAQYKEAKGNMVNFVIGMGLMNAMTIGAGALAGSVLHKKDDKKTAKETGMELTTNTLLNFTGNPVLKTALGGSGYALQKAFPKAFGGKGQKATAESFGNDITSVVPDMAYTFGRIFEDLNSNDPAARKLKKITTDALSSRAFESSLAMARIPTWYLRYPAMLLRNRLGDSDKGGKKPSSSSAPSSSSGSSRLFSGKRTFGNSRTFGGKRMF